MPFISLLDELEQLAGDEGYELSDEMFSVEVEGIRKDLAFFDGGNETDERIKKVANARAIAALAFIAAMPDDATVRDIRDFAMQCGEAVDRTLECTTMARRARELAAAG